MLNHVAIAGRITKQPEMRTTQSGKNVTSFTVAVERDYQPGGEKKVDFINCVIWGAGANFVSTYFNKGSMILVTGRMESRQWEDKHSQKRTDWEVIADHVYFGGDKRQENNDYQPPQAQNVSAADFVELDDDPENPLPF
jgi:single-strand DNA-binding protein